MMFEIVVTRRPPGLHGYTVADTKDVASGALVPGREIVGREAGLGFAQAEKKYRVGAVGHEWRGPLDRASRLVVHLVEVES